MRADLAERPQTPLLDTIHTPADLRALPREKLAQVAGELRAEMIDAVSVTGGHLGAVHSADRGREELPAGRHPLPALRRSLRSGGVGCGLLGEQAGVFNTKVLDFN